MERKKVKIVYANANPVMYTDPTGYFSLAESSVAQGIQGVLNNVLTPMFNIKKMMSWANMAVTMYDIAQQFNILMSGEATVMGLAKAIAKGMITQALLNCALTKVLGEAATTVIKLIGVAQDTGSFIEAVKSGDPERIMVESLRLVVSLYSLKCECFTGETLVSTTEGDKRIDAIEVGDYVFAYDTEKQENVPAKVTYVSITETDILVHVYTSEGEEIKTTMFHPFYVKNVKNGEDETYGIWKASANLVAGDELLTEDGRVVYVREVRIERLAESIKVYNLEVEGLHTYYVGSGILVHNEYGGKKNASDSNESGSNPDVKDLIDDIPDKLKTNGKCNQFAQNLTKRLDEKGIPYKIIRVDSFCGIYSDKAGTEIGLGFHYGIQIDDLVYDNMTTGGMKFNDWLKDLGIGFPGIDWDYAEKINSH